MNPPAHPYPEIDSIVAHRPIERPGLRARLLNAALPHVFHVFADFVPEGGFAIRRISEFLREHA
jgi:hypothetical protein